jgi:DNA-binding transcriptional MerR regulator
MTVGGLAERLRPRDLTTTLERLKHYARLGLLEPTEQMHRGTGRHRLYDDRPETVLSAAVLDVLADTGISIATHRDAAVAVLGLVPKALRAQQRSRALWIEIAHRPGRPNPVVTLHEDTITPDAKSETVIMINVGALMNRLSLE